MILKIWETITRSTIMQKLTCLGLIIGTHNVCWGGALRFLSIKNINDFTRLELTKIALHLYINLF